MTPLALAAILGSAVLHAAWNAIVKHAADQAGASVLVSAGAAAITAVLVVAVGPADVPPAGWPFVVAAGLVEGAYFVSLSRALAALPLGTAYGLSRGAGLLMVWPVSIAWLGERVDLPEVGGALLVSGGLFALVQASRSRAGLAAAAVCAVTIGAYPVTYKAALERGVSPFPLFAIALAISLPVQIALLGPERRTRIARSLSSRHGWLALAAILCAASFLLFLVALRATGAGRVTALRNTSVLFAAALGWAAGESLDARSMISALAIAAGAVLLVG